MASIASRSTEEHSVRLAQYAVAALIGLIGANIVTSYVATQQYAAWISLVSGVALLVGAAMYKDGQWYGGLIRIAMALGGVVLLLRGGASVLNASSVLHQISQNVV
jgi:hypothetical protein